MFWFTSATLPPQQGMSHTDPMRRGKKKLLAASITSPLLAKTNPIFASLYAILIFMGKVIVTPTPTAAPLSAAIVGFLHLLIAIVTRPPPSL